MIDKFRIIRISFMISIVAVAVFVFAVTIRYNLLDMVHEKGLSSTSYWVLERVRKRLLAPERAPKGAYFSAVKGNYWLKESSDARESLPLYKTIKAIDPSQYPKSMPPDNLNFKTWTRSHGDNFNSKYASISQINKKNVRGLQRVWVYNSGEGDWKSDKGIKANNVETNPIFVNGKIFTTTPDAHIVAIDAKSGGELWRFKFAKGVPARRGMVWWKGDINHKPRIYLPIGGRLYAIDPDTGKPIEGFGDQGFVKISKSFVAPVIDQDRVIVATFAPSLVAFNVFTGKKIWETGLLESGEMPKKAGPFVISGGAPWSGIALDKERHIIFASTGNARQALYGALRPGDNKNSNSLVAIDGLTGSVLWAFQEVAHDLWDYDIPSPPTLTSIKKEDQLVDVVLVSTKIGNTIILERETGKPIYDFRLKRAPVSRIPGEKTAPYQPDLEKPEPFSQLEFRKEDITDIGWSNKSSVLQILKNARYGSFMPPHIGKYTAVCCLAGGAQWPGVAIDHPNQMMFIPSNQIPYVVYLEYVNKFDVDLNISERKTYQKKCASCHGDNRNGIYDVELAEVKSNNVCGSCHYVTPEQKRLKIAPHPFPPPENDSKLPIPSITGITLVENQKDLRSLPRFIGVHQGLGLENKVSQADLDETIDYFLAVDKEIDARGGFMISHHWKKIYDLEGYPGSKPPWGLLTALDLSTGKIRWQRAFGEYEELTSRGVPVTGQPNFGGLIATSSGLVFATGTMDKKIRAFDAETGEILWEDTLPAPGSAPPLTYKIDGVQYITVVATGSRFPGFESSDAVVTYRLQ